MTTETELVELLERAGKDPRFTMQAFLLLRQYRRAGMILCGSTLQGDELIESLAKQREQLAASLRLLLAPSPWDFVPTVTVGRDPKDYPPQF